MGNKINKGKKKYTQELYAPGYTHAHRHPTNTNFTTFETNISINPKHGKVLGIITSA
jgi:hypothetical protein